MAAVVRVVHHAGAVPRLWRRTIHALFESADPPATQSAVPGAPGHELRAIRVGALWHNPGTSQLVRARAQLLGADATRPPLADSLKCHLSTTPGESDRLANFSSVPTFVIQHHDQTVSWSALIVAGAAGRIRACNSGEPEISSAPCRDMS